MSNHYGRADARILALDIGSKYTGWRGAGSGGTLDLSMHDDYGAVVSLFDDWLCGLIEQIKPTLLAVEQPIYRRVNQLGALTIGLVKTAHAVAWCHNVPRTERPASAVRRWLLGSVPKGDAALDRAIRQALAERGVYPGTEHEADAAALELFVTAGG